MSRMTALEAKNFLVETAENLYSDSFCYQPAVMSFKAQLVELAVHMESLEQAGYEIHVEHPHWSAGWAKLMVKRGNIEFEIYSYFYSSHERWPLGTNYMIAEIQRRVSLALRKPFV